VKQGKGLLKEGQDSRREATTGRYATNASSVRSGTNAPSPIDQQKHERNVRSHIETAGDFFVDGSNHRFGQLF
jgi:hypothetical protein